MGALEDQCGPGLEKETIRLQAANILIKQKKFDHARLLLVMITTESLSTQKQKLLDQLPATLRSKGAQKAVAGPPPATPARSSSCPFSPSLNTCSAVWRIPTSRST